jgi:hypothetical protein
MSRLGIWVIGASIIGVIGCGDDGMGKKLPPPSVLKTPNREITGGAQRVRGQRYAADVEIGHPIGQQPAAGGQKRLEGNTAVKP